MEITIIHGQTHKGSTYHITEQIKNKLCNENTVIHEFFMPTDTPHYCIGCFKCIMKGEQYCPHSESVQKIVSAIEMSNIIMVDSPTYCFEMTGQLKTLFDHLAYMWLSHRPNKTMFNKVGIVVSTAAGAGAKNVTRSIANQLFWIATPKCYKLPLKVNASSWEDVPANMKKKIETKTDKIAKKATTKSNTSIKMKFIFSMMRLSQKSNEWNITDKNHWEENGWLNKKRPWKK